MEQHNNYPHNISNKEKLSNDKAYYKFYGSKYRKDGNVDFTRLKENYMLANGEIDEATFKHVYAPFGTDTRLPVKFKHKDIVSPTIKRVVGIASTRKFKNRLVAVNSEALSRKREEERNRYSQIVVARALNQIAQQLESQIPPDAPNRAALIEEEALKATPESVKKHMAKKHVDVAEVVATHIQNFTLLDQDADTTFLLATYDAAVCGKYILYTGIEQKKAVLKRIDPRAFTYTRTTSSPFIKDFDQGTVHLYLSIPKILEAWGDIIDDTTLNKLRALITDGMSSPTFAFSAFEDDAASPIRYDENTGVDITIFVSHSIWRAETKKGILTYINKEGVEDVVTVDEDYIMDKENGDISIEWKSVPELHECIMAGSDIIIKAGPVEGQMFDVDNMFQKDLPFMGVLLNSYGSECKGLVDYQKPYAALYDVILFRIEEFMSKDKGKLVFMNEDMLPAGIAPDKFFAYAEQNNIAFFSNKDLKNVDKNVSSHVKEIDRSMIAKIDQYIDLANYVELKCKTAVGINPQFEGEIQEREGVRNVEKAVGATSLALEPMFYLMDVAKNQIVKALVYNQIVAIIRYKRKHISYILDEVGLVTVELDPDLLLESQYTMFMEDGSKQTKIIDILTQYAANKAQTEQLTLSALGRFLQEDDLNSALSILEESERISHDNAKELEQMRTQGNLELEQAKLQAAKDLETHKTDNELRVVDAKGEQEIIKAAIVGSGFAEDKDMNNNSVPDIIEIANSMLEKQKFEYQKIQDSIKNKQEDKKLDIEAKKASKPTSK